MPELTGDAEDQGKSGGDKEQAGRGGETVDEPETQALPSSLPDDIRARQQRDVDALVCAAASGSSTSASSR